MGRDRLIQLAAAGVMAAAVAGGGMLLPSILDLSRTRYLRYTDEPVEGAPPIVALGTAIGALRGLIVDYLWIKVTYMKERGQYYEAMHDADLITKLQPRFAQVWAFHGHNLAYNISVAVGSRPERWEWVKAGIDLVRNKGLRYNPNDLSLHRELAFWFKHKIEGVSDDAHLYYKREFRREWHFLLGEPPLEQEARVAWIKAVADAPATLEEAERRTPGVKALVERLRSTLAPYEQRFKFALDRHFLRVYTLWEAVKRDSIAARVLGIEQQMRQESGFFDAFDAIAADSATAPAMQTLIGHVRRRVLEDEYNMDPRLMHEFTRDLGPIDWRHGEAHALYWSRLGSIRGEKRILDVNEVYKRMNNDRIQVQAMQSLAKGGRITVDPFDDLSNRIPTQFPEPRWIEVIWKEFDRLYVKYDPVRGMGGDIFIDFLENFMTAAVRDAYRSGELARAQQILDRLDERFGRGGSPPSLRFASPLDLFVRDETRGEYEFQPELARSEVGAALRGGLVALAQDRPEVFEQSKRFAAEVIQFFKGNEYNKFVNRFGEARMGALLGSLDACVRDAIDQTMRSPGIPLQARLTIWSKLDRYGSQEKLQAYSDSLRTELAEQLSLSYLGRTMTIDQALPKPPGWDQMQEALRMRQERHKQREQQERGGAPMR